MGKWRDGTKEAQNPATVTLYSQAGRRGPESFPADAYCSQLEGSAQNPLEEFVEDLIYFFYKWLVELPVKPLKPLFNPTISPLKTICLSLP